MSMSGIADVRAMLVDELTVTEHEKFMFTNSWSGKPLENGARTETW